MRNKEDQIHRHNNSRNLKEVVNDKMHHQDLANMPHKLKKLQLVIHSKKAQDFTKNFKNRQGQVSILKLIFLQLKITRFLDLKEAYHLKKRRDKVLQVLENMNWCKNKIYKTILLISNQEIKSHRMHRKLVLDIIIPFINTAREVWVYQKPKDSKSKQKTIGKFLMLMSALLLGHLKCQLFKDLHKISARVLSNIINQML